MTKKLFYGWWVTAAAICTFGISSGYSVLQHAVLLRLLQEDGGSRRIRMERPRISHSAFPSPRCSRCGSGRSWCLASARASSSCWEPALTACAFFGFSSMKGDLTVYYFFWFLYTIGYILSGPIPASDHHFPVVSQSGAAWQWGSPMWEWPIFGSIGSKLVKPLTESHGFRYTLAFMGGLMFLAWPVALLVLRDKPSEKGLFPDDDPKPQSVAASPEA